MNIRIASTLIHFLWQGTLVAFLYGAVRSWARVRNAETRYLVSCAAMLLMTLAPVMTFWLLAPPEPVYLPGGVSGSVPSSFPGADVIRIAPAASVSGSLTDKIVFAWLAGVVLFSVRLAGGYFAASRARSVRNRPAPPEWQESLDRIRIRLRISRTVQLAVSAFVQVPMVVGWLRPVVLAPLGTLTGLEPALVEALLAHELAHIRRHDYLINVLQGIVETVLFYHPAIWWISHRIREERELCCDDIAVAVCGDTLTYVRALTEIETYRSVHPAPALAANGGSLPARVARLLGMRYQPANSPVSFLAALTLLVAGCSLFAQSAAAPAFEVASIKQNKSGATRAPSVILPGGRFTATNNTVRALILNAYGISSAPSLLSGGPGWIDSDTWDIDARAAAGAIPASVSGKPLWEQTRLMLRTLLADRFKLSMQRAAKEMSIYELVVAKGGPKLKTTTADCTSGPYACHGFSGNPRRYTGTGVDTYDLALLLTGYSDRLVVDKTGLKGTYDVLLQWNVFAGRAEQQTPDAPQPQSSTSKEGTGPMPDSASLPNVFDALEQEAGLKLQAQKGLVDAWVIDRVERPSEN